MSIKSIYNLSYSLIIIFLLLMACANPVAPTGGPKDETPPMFIGSEPVNRARNFSADKIYLEFDEFVVLKELKAQLLVSPPMENKLDIKTKGKGVQIKFDKSEILDDSTTYTIYFGDAITDLHENNPVPNFQYVFSTGQEIDSLSIRGRVLNAEYLKPAEAVFVCLYIDNNDTLPLNELPQNVRPFYVAKTNAEGFFEINNIRNASYLIFAVQDANANYFNDMPNEAIAFLRDFVIPEEVFDYIPDTIPIDTTNAELMDSLWANYAIQVTKDAHTLLLYLPQDSVQRVLEENELENGMLFTFKYPLKEKVKIDFLDIDEGDESEVYLEEYSLNKDSLRLWFLKPFADTLRFSIAVDTLKIDTIEFSLNTVPKEEDSRARRNRNQKETKKVKAPSIGYSDNITKEFNYFSKAKIEFETPISIANFDNCSLSEDSIAVKFTMNFVDEIKRKLVINYDWKQGKSYRFEIPDMAFTDIYGLKNDSIVVNFSTSEESKYGELKIQIELPTKQMGPWLVQLFKGEEEKEQSISEVSISKSGPVVFPHLVEASYRLKILEDRDANGKWSSGDYAKSRLPESVYYFPTDIEMKAGWKVEESWELSPDMQKNNSFKVKKKK